MCVFVSVFVWVCGVYFSSSAKKKHSFVVSILNPFMLRVVRTIAFFSKQVLTKFYVLIMMYCNQLNSHLLQKLRNL